MSSPSRPRILVIRRRYLGDVVLLGPVFRNLRIQWPDAHLAALVEPAYAAVLTMNPDVNLTLGLPRKTFEWPVFIRRLRAEKFTHVLDLDNNDRTAWLARLSGAPFRAALWHEGAKARWRELYTADVFDPPAVHEQRSIVDYYLAILGALNVPIASRDVRLSPLAVDIATAQKLAPSGGRKLLIHPGSRSAYRVWPAENFAMLSDRLQEELGVQVFVIGGPNEQALVDAIRQRAKTHLVAINQSLSVPQFAAFAAQFGVMLCHDSGPMHVAAAVGTPIVALLGSQNPVLFAPPGAGHVVIQPPLPCVNCIDPLQCRRDDSYHNFCVRNISVDDVWRVLRPRLAGDHIASSQKTP